MKFQGMFPCLNLTNLEIKPRNLFQDSYSKLMEACSDVSASYDKWMSRLTISSWLTHVKDILNCGCLVAQCVEQVWDCLNS